ncbi:LysM peptidoglycan-binding domain-containing protein [Thalassotalea ponticola]|uniref:LysM peptidoglycan-binding domain-containing protein n=1 Tax=Thalassotalea ponticola TaxID=1523392 RepID=UPI0025B31ECE|nr:LysM peptidoglycan-binding domain-containing protein [Thalassotalea ponticola]MDN3651408.1 LysM peptidoglycan-binding domain-containing protein [Thalassotalea ponticola]
MKKIILPLTLSALVGCQHVNQPKTEQNLPVNSASRTDIYQALLTDESADVIHPKQDVDIPLNENQDGLVVDNIWDRIRAQLTFEIPDNSKVRAHRDWYAKHPTYLDRVAKRAEPFIYYITEELEKHNMPMELVLLPVVESAYDPFAYSHGSASGMWQFLSRTGKSFGLHQDWWYDGRRDVAASTQAAIKYLKYLNKRFDGDWLLALAAYNSGEGRVAKAMRDNARKGRPTDFWNLRLPKETRDYVPKLLGLAAIVKDPQNYNVELYPINNEPVISSVNIGSQLDLSLAAKLSGLTVDELHALNPGLNRWATPPNGPHTLLLPTTKVEQFSQALEQLDSNQRLSWQRYKIKSGDSLSVIAKRYNTTVDVIRETNDLTNNVIVTGNYLLIPTATQSLDRYTSYEQVRLNKLSKKGEGSKVTHTVKHGDTLWDIGKLYNVSSKDIAKWNGFAPKDMLKLGQKLTIWTGNTSSNKQGVTRNIQYKVKSGDSLARIASRFNVKIKDIEKWNNLSRKKYLQPGQILKLSVNVTSI